MPAAPTVSTHLLEHRMAGLLSRPTVATAPPRNLDMADMVPHLELLRPTVVHPNNTTGCR